MKSKMKNKENDIKNLNKRVTTGSLMLIVGLKFLELKPSYVFEVCFYCEKGRGTGNTILTVSLMEYVLSE